jgi:DNA-binding transcriptional MerR regulator/effector-binding domain-containing protein
MYSIGEFSKITGMTVKTLRFYQEQGLLTPSAVDPRTGYRCYGAEKIEVARIIGELRTLDFPLAEITEILRADQAGASLLEHLERQQQAIAQKLANYKQINAALGRIIEQERQARTAMADASFDVEEKTIEPTLVAGIRMRGRYSDCGKAFGRIARRFGRHLCGKPIMLHYDSEYKENDADFEACMPVRMGADVDGIAVRQLAGGRCVTLMHRGPYDELGRSYAKVLDYMKTHGLAIDLPTREIYHKGPGMIFKGNPRKYLTEIQIPVRSA